MITDSNPRPTPPGCRAYGSGTASSQKRVPGQVIENTPRPRPDFGRLEKCPPECARAGIEITVLLDYLRSIVGIRCLAGVILRAEASWTHSGDHGQELLERHLEIEEAALAENPSVVIQNLIRDHHRQTRQCRYDGKWMRLSRMDSVPYTGLVGRAVRLDRALFAQR